MDKSDFDQNWMSDVSEKVEDPMLASLICKLGRHTNSILSTANSEEMSAHFDSVLDVCRTSQHLRLHVGNMQYMDAAARDFVCEALQVAIDSFADAGQIEASDQKEFKEATKNIQYRLELMAEDKVLLQNE